MSRLFVCAVCIFILPVVLVLNGMWWTAGGALISNLILWFWAYNIGADRGVNNFLRGIHDMSEGAPITFCVGERHIEIE